MFIGFIQILYQGKQQFTIRNLTLKHGDQKKYKYLKQDKMNINY